MEIPEINMISNFEAGMNCLQNPSLISPSFTFPAVQNVFQVYSFWKWGALVFAVFATFSSIIRRVRIIFFRFYTIKPSLVEEKQIVYTEDDEISVESSDFEREDGNEEDDEEEESSPTTSLSGDQQRGDEDFRVRASGELRHRGRRVVNGGESFDWSDFTSGKSVVKLWDSLSSSFSFGEAFCNFDSNDVVSLWNFDGYSESIGHPSRPVVVLTAVGNGADSVVLRGYDARARRRAPSLYAEWRAPSSLTIPAAVTRKDNGALTVGDVRNVRMPLANAGESDGETWWDADAVIVEHEFVMVDK